MSVLSTRAKIDRRLSERRQMFRSIEHHERRADVRRGYLDRRQDPLWRQRWLRQQVIAALRESHSTP